MDRRGRDDGWAVLLLGWLGIAATAVALAATRDGPGMLYDEAWLAQQARAFVDPLREGLMPPGTQKVWLLGRPFPLFALPYLGSLKSQLLIPWIALFGNELETVRFATLATALAALLATMVAARRAFGLRVALLAGLLLATDPTVAFHASCEWGPFTTGWLCRALGAALLLRGHALRRRAPTLAGGLVLGLGIYNRADFVLIGAAVLIGLGVFHADALRAIWRERRGELLGAAGLLVLGALPMLLNTLRVVATMGELTTRGDLAERVNVLIATLDGSYPWRLMAVGGRYDALQTVDPPTALLGAAVLLALIACAVAAARGGRGALADGRGVLAIAVVGIGAAMLALPGATRAHHMLNLAPFAHVLVAATVVHEADRGGARRAIAVALALAVIASGALSIASTRALIERTGGRGWWTDAIAELARELEAEPNAVAVSLDWGFHLQLLFSTEHPTVIEPFWHIARDVEQQGMWGRVGDASHVYLVHEAPYDRFGFGHRLLEAARSLGEVTSIRTYRDREGATAFHAVRIARPHRLRIDRSGIHFDL
jgi:hypothetical protein